LEVNAVPVYTVNLPAHFLHINPKSSNDPILTIFLESYLVSLVVSGSSSGDFDVSFPYANNFWFECLSETAMNKKDKANPS